MRKGFRRLLVLVMVVATVCLLSTSAFANENFGFADDFDNGNVYLDTHGEIKEKSTTGSIVVTNRIQPSLNYVSIQVTYHYYPDELNGVMQTRYKSDGDMMGTAAVGSSTTDNIYIMFDATYTVSAEFTTSYGTQPFNPDPWYLEYEQ